MGYISESNGDRESADYYLCQSREANRSSARVALATRKNLQGMKFASVADEKTSNWWQDAQEKQLAGIRRDRRCSTFAACAPAIRLVVREPATPPKPEPRARFASSLKTIPPPEHPARHGRASPASQSQPDALSWTVHLRPIATSDRRSHGQASGTAGNASASCHSGRSTSTQQIAGCGAERIFKGLC